MENVEILSTEELAKEKQLLGEMDKIDTESTIVSFEEKLGEPANISTPSPDIITDGEVVETLQNKNLAQESNLNEAVEHSENDNEDTNKDSTETDYSLLPPLESFTMVSNQNETSAAEEKTSPDNSSLIKTDTNESGSHTDDKSEEFITPRSMLESEPSEELDINDEVVEEAEVSNEEDPVEAEAPVEDTEEKVEEEVVQDKEGGPQQPLDHDETVYYDEEIPKTSSSFDIVDHDEIDELQLEEEEATINVEPDDAAEAGEDEVVEPSTPKEHLGEHLGDLFKYKTAPHDDQCWSTASTCSNDTIMQQKVFAEIHAEELVADAEKAVLDSERDAEDAPQIEADTVKETAAEPLIAPEVEPSAPEEDGSGETNVAPQTGEQTVTPAGEEAGPAEEAEKETAPSEATVETDNAVNKETEKVAADEWVNVLGNDSLKKKIKSPGCGANLEKGQQVTMIYSLMLSSGELVDEDVKQNFQLGDGEVINAIDLTANLARVGEVYEVVAQSRFAYGALGRPPKIGGNCSVLLTVEIVHAEETPKVEDMNEADRITIGDRKRKIGNDYFARFDYDGASKNYRGACMYLDPPSYKIIGEPSETLKDLSAKSWCNLAIAELKQDKIDNGLTAVNRALEIDPKSTKALYRKGKLLEQKGDLDKAEVAVKLALQIDPKSQGCKSFLKELTQKIASQKKRQQRMYKKMFNLEDDKGEDSAPPSEKDTTWLEGAIPMVAGAVTVGALAVAAYSAIKSYSG